MNNARLLMLVVSATLLSQARLAIAAQPQFQGFFSQAVIYSGDNPFFDDDTGINFNFREFGLNLSWRANDNVRFAGQVISRKAGVLDDGDPRLDFLLVDYNFYNSESVSAGIRLGRVKNHYGLYNTTRDVPHGRPGVFAPQSVYFESLRSALLSSDGGDFYLSLNNDFADTTIDIYGGRAHFYNESIEYQLFQTDMPGEFDDVDGVGMKATVEPNAVPDLTLGLTVLSFNAEYQDAPKFAPSQIPTALAALLANPSTYPNYVTSLELDAMMYLYSIQYTVADWIITAEYLNIDLELGDTSILYTPIPLPRDQINVEAYYAQLEWLASAELSVYSRYEELYYDKNDKSGKQYALLTGGNPITQYDKAWTLGARWYFTPDLSVTAEYSLNEGAAFVNGQADVDYSALKKYWDLFILQFSFHF